MLYRWNTARTLRPVTCWKCCSRVEGQQGKQKWTSNSECQGDLCLLEQRLPACMGCQCCGSKPAGGKQQGCKHHCLVLTCWHTCGQMSWLLHGCGLCAVPTYLHDGRVSHCPSAVLLPTHGTLVADPAQGCLQLTLQAAMWVSWGGGQHTPAMLSSDLLSIRQGASMHTSSASQWIAFKAAAVSSR